MCRRLYCLGLCKYTVTFAQRRNRLMTHFTERTPVVKRRISVFSIPPKDNKTATSQWVDCCFPFAPRNINSRFRTPTLTGSAMDREVSRRPRTAESRVRFQAYHSGHCGVQSGPDKELALLISSHQRSSFIFPFIHLFFDPSPVLYNVSN